ncbi:MAG: tyrosine-type recombinase/integrase [Thermogemmatispora sp.]|uniref:tyrosine-type recombinase/integrase n=1 Tax=Thermogemmatispora sp. TaxID=1968838 RepID=UPI00263244EC|nr:tyrosine-type recombinase/integrase [Thermogemmatispora sp.]MBX5458820.1 tyrosine-type recombinase/integrase [Thermogemmatispora sp.]
MDQQTFPSSSLLSLATQPTGARRKQARSSRQQTRHLSEQRVGRQPRRQHIEALVEAYLQSQIGGNRSPKTIEWHRTSLTLLRRFLQQQRGVTEIEAVEAEDISAWFTYLRTTRGSHGRQRRERTVQTYARSARAFFHWLERRRLLEENVFDLVPFPRAGRPLIETLTDEEFERLLAACAPPRKTGRLAKRATARNRAILWVLYDTGIRLSELLTLCLDKVDRRRGVITVWGKGAKERRVALGENCQHYLFEYLDQHWPDEQELAKWGRAGEKYLFLTETCRPLTKNGIEELFRRLRKRAGITAKRVSPHILRHTFAVKYLLLGGDPFSLQRLLGHEEMATVNHYMHLNDTMMQAQKRKYSPGDYLSTRQPEPD